MGDLRDHHHKDRRTTPARLHGGVPDNFAVPSSWPSAWTNEHLSVGLQTIAKDLQRVVRGEATDGSAAAHHDIDDALGSDQETGRVEVGFIVVVCVVGTVTRGEFLRLQTVSHREAHSGFFDGLHRLLESLGGGSNYIDSVLGELRDLVLEVSQLLTTEWSPVSSIDQQESPLVGGKRKRSASDQI